MTINELLAELRIVGGESTFSDRNLLIYSINRALRRLYADQRIEKTVRLATRRPKPIAYYKEIHSKDGDIKEIPITGKSFSMRIHGECTYVVTDGPATTVRTIDSKNEATLIKGFLTYGGKISIWSSFAYTIYDLAVYDEIYSERPNDIPEYGIKITFNLRDIYGDFMSFTTPATDLAGNPIKSARLYDGKVEVGSDYTGEIMLSYRCLPTEISLAEDDNSTEIVVPNEYSHLFVLLVAYYGMLFKDDDKATKFLDQYTEAIASFRAYCYQQVDFDYKDTTGWA